MTIDVRRKPLIAALGLSLAVLLAGCSFGDADTDGDAANAVANEDADLEIVDTFDGIAADQAVNDLVPEGIETISVVMAQGSKPISYVGSDGSTSLGLNADLGRALARVMDVDVEVEVIPFDGIIPGLQSQKYTLAIASMSPTEERLQVLDMLPYGLGGSAIVVPTGNPLDLTSATLCGHRVAVQSGTFQETTRLPRLNEETCVANGEEDIDVIRLPDQNQALLALSSGRADALMGDGPVMGLTEKQRPDDIQILEDDSHLTSIAGMALVKDSELTPAFLEAMRKLRTLPEYDAIFEKWGMSSLVLPSERIIDSMRSDEDGIL